MSNSLKLAGYGREWLIKNASFSAVSGGWYLLDASTSFSITLPASPSSGDTIKFALVAGDAEANSLTVARNGQTIEGLAEDMTVASNSPRAFDMYFNGSTWRVFV